MSRATKTGWRSLDSLLLSTMVPEAWPDRTEPGADAAAAAEGRWTVRPNVVITSQPSRAPIAEVAEQVLAESTGIRLPVQLLSADVWTFAGAPGRRFEFVYETPDAAVLVTVWVFATGRHRVELTATRDLADAVGLQPVIQAIESRIAVHEPGVDAVPSEVLAAEPEKTLEVIPAPSESAPPERPAFLLSAAERDLLFSSRGRGLQAGRARSSEGAALRDAGLLTRFGGTTPEAERLLATTDGVRTLIWRRSAAGWAARLYWELDDAVLVDRWEAPTEEALPRAEHRIELLDAGRGAADLLRWYGVHPTWTYSDPEPLAVPSEAVEQRVLQGPTDPPADAGRFLQRSWAASPWVEFIATFGRSGHSWRTIRAGGTGWLQMAPADEGHVHLLPLPTANLVLALLNGGVG